MTTERDALTSRSIPHMTLGKGEPGTPSGPLAPLSSSSLSPADRAARRFGLEDKNAIITGGAGDLGTAVSRALLEHGLAGLMVFDLWQAPAGGDDGAAAQEPPSVAGLRAEFPDREIGFLKIDVTDEEAGKEAVGKSETRFREAARQRAGEQDKEVAEAGVDILLNFAGVVACGHALDFSAHDWNRVLGINVVGGAVAANAVARSIVARNERVLQKGKVRGGSAGTSTRPEGLGGSILFVASISSHRVNFPQPQAPYNASKAAVRSLVQSLAAEWAVHGIRVNSVSPGYMDTVLNAGDGLAELRRAWADRCPTGRMGVPDELAGVVIMLVSGAGNYVTGADLLVDGGQTLLM